MEKIVQQQKKEITLLEARISEYTKEECNSSDEYKEDKESDVDMEEIADLVKD